MEEMAKHGRLGLASARAGMDRKTARKYVEEGKFPSELEQERTWRTREDPFEEQWASLAERLKEAPELEAKTLFEELCAREPGRYKPGQLRTLQRRVRQRRASSGLAEAAAHPLVGDVSVELEGHGHAMLRDGRASVVDG